MREVPVEEFCALVGQELVGSRWFEIDQARIDGFARNTEDRQFIHVKPDLAAKTPFGDTVAHGFLSMSMLAATAFDAQPIIKDRVMPVKYGFDRVRMLNPLRSGRRVRGRFVLTAIADRGPKEFMTKTQATAEVEGLDKPALVADWLGIIHLA